VAGFTSELQTAWMEDGRKRVLAPHRYSIGDKDSGLYIEAETGFVSDITSIPWWLQPLIRKEGGEGPCSVIHDKAYKSGSMTVAATGEQVHLTQAFADSVFREAMRVPRKDGTLAVNPIRREVLYWGLVFGGFVAWRKHRIANQDREWTRENT